MDSKNVNIITRSHAFVRTKYGIVIRSAIKCSATPQKGANVKDNKVGNNNSNAASYPHFN